MPNPLLKVVSVILLIPLEAIKFQALTRKRRTREEDSGGGGGQGRG